MPARARSSLGAPKMEAEGSGGFCRASELQEGSLPGAMASKYPALEGGIGSGWRSFIEVLLRASNQSALELAADIEPLPATKGLMLS
jgi:hypothetical protein